MAAMFYKDHNLETVPLFDTSHASNMSNMFRECSSLTTVPLFDTSSVTNMNSMFRYCNSLTQLPLFDTSHVTNFASMLSGNVYDTNGETVISTVEMHLANVPNFDFSASTRLDDFMGGNVSITTIPTMNIGSSITRVDDMFNVCPNVQSGAKDLYDTLSQIGTITNHTNAFKDCGSNTQTGQAELAQIPVSWGGTMAEPGE